MLIKHNLNHYRKLLTMNLYPKNKIPLRKIKKFIVIFYMVGTLGFLIPFTNSLFIAITPFALLLNTYLLAIYHKKHDIKHIGVFVFIFITGFFIEMIGVNTGIIFGSYQYGSGLGIKIAGTPLLIGVNWLFLTYTSISVLDGLKINKNLSVIIAPTLMLTYDLVLEQVAPRMDMWSWQNNSVPLQNYVAWFLIALVFVAIMKIFKINTKNSLSRVLLTCQFLFFIALMLILK